MGSSRRIGLTASVCAAGQIKGSMKVTGKLDIFMVMVLFLGQTEESSLVVLCLTLGNYKHGKKTGFGEMFKEKDLISRGFYHEGRLIEEKKVSNSQFLKIDSDMFNDSKSYNLTSKFSRTSKGSECYDIDG